MTDEARIRALHREAAASFDFAPRNTMAARTIQAHDRSTDLRLLVAGLLFGMVAVLFAIGH